MVPSVAPLLLLLSVLPSSLCPRLLLEFLASTLSCELLVLGSFDFGSSFGEGDRGAFLFGEELGLHEGVSWSGFVAEATRTFELASFSDRCLASRASIESGVLADDIVR